MRIIGSFVIIALALLAFSPVLAEEAIEPPQRSAEHEKLAFWLGSWSGTGELKPGMFGPGGPMEWTEDCSWFSDGMFSVVCKSKSSGAMGSATALVIIGYHTGKEKYTHYGVDSNGWIGHSLGTRSGDTWTFESTEAMEGKTYNSRFTVKMSSPKEMSFSLDMSEDGENWTTLMEGTSKKK